ncbi:hypothetical protein OSB04_006169 [Centaurea solstitialis]|uniref:NADH:quinone oxidoreductase/Mrp antiporter transmembrane domain-containing protein n=1 Tax=Centaurea solstitialis TaxID=347529 RepID=A0AA38TJ58_9ASTR|nr:hypothetical protein OSB04_006169 [Centaurea solstitialis]
MEYHSQEQSVNTRLESSYIRLPTKENLIARGVIVDSEEATSVGSLGNQRASISQLQESKEVMNTINSWWKILPENCLTIEELLIKDMDGDTTPECFSLCSYLLSGYTKKDVRSNEATMKYLLMGGASSSILVHGFSWLYGSSGGEIELQEIVNGLINTQMYNSPGISIALIFITVGIGFKLSPAPSHQWTPDVYEGVRFVR